MRADGYAVTTSVRSVLRVAAAVIALCAAAEACSTGANGAAVCAAGATQSCGVTLPGATKSGVLSCITGTQTCAGGQWGACKANGTITSQAAFPGTIDERGNVHTLGLATSQQCVNDPCDPTCQYFPSPDGGANDDATGGVTYLSGQVPLSALPNGWTKVDQDPCTDNVDDCEFDSYCSAGTCTLYSPGQKGSCNGVDFTAPAACNASGGSTLFPICNRGTQDATSGLVSVGFDMSPPPSGTCAPTGGGYPGKGSCIIDLSASPIKAGSCIDVDPVNLINVQSCSGINVNGNRDVFVNYDLTYKTECNVCNNEGMKKAGTSCSPTTVTSYAPASYTFTYVATCGSGFVPEWTALAFVSSTPSDTSGTSNVTFVGQLGDQGADGGATTLVGSSVTLANTPSVQPNTCGLFGPSPCPVNLTSAFGGTNASEHAVLQLTINLNPAPDATVAPTVSSWQLTYDCVANQ